MDETVGSMREAGEDWVRGSVLGPREGAELLARPFLWHAARGVSWIPRLIDMLRSP
jgi:hypothetical protein